MNSKQINKNYIKITITASKQSGIYGGTPSASRNSVQ
jgi:hypothetical protein